MPLMDNFQQLWLSLGSAKLLLAIGQTLLLALVAGVLYQKFIRSSQVAQLVKGVLIILMTFVGLWLTTGLLNLTVLEGFFGVGIQVLIVGLMVIFQPELRRGLLVLGQGEFLTNATTGANAHEDRRPAHLVHELVETVHFLSKSKRGALIVLESPHNAGTDYLEVGTQLDARLSTELLLTIFHPNTPLHDGAVVISPVNRIVAAGVLLPLTENPELSWQYGTRHRAAIGLTEISDSRCVVVSEETGAISLVYQGRLDRVETAEALRKDLERIYHVSLKSTEGRSTRKRLADLLGMENLSGRLQTIFKITSSDAPAEKKTPIESGKSQNKH